MRHRAKPFQPLPEFAHLRPDQLEYIHDLLRDSTLADVQQQLHMDLGVRSLRPRSIATAPNSTSPTNSISAPTPPAPSNNSATSMPPASRSSNNAPSRSRLRPKPAPPSSKTSTASSPTKTANKKNNSPPNSATRTAWNSPTSANKPRLQISADRRATAEKTLAHRQDIDSQKLQLARERHALELRKQEHREKIDAATAPKHNPNANDEAAMRAEALLEYGRQLRRQREAAAAASSTQNSALSTQNLVCPTFISRDAITPTSAAPDARKTLTPEQQTN